MYEFKVSGMTCPSCARAMKKALIDLDESVQVEVNLPMQTVRVKTQLEQKTVAARIEEAGYPVLSQKIMSESEA